MEFVATAVIMFLAGMAVGMCVMYIADSRYIRTIRSSCRRIQKICKQDVHKKKYEIERLNTLVNELQIELAKRKEKEEIDA